MSRTEPSSTRIRILYEIALAIQPEETLRRTVESAVSTYLQKLDCAAAAVFEADPATDCRDYELVASLPEGSSLTETAIEPRERLPNPEADLRSVLPRTDELPGDIYTEGSRQELESGGYEQALENEFSTDERVLETSGGKEITTLLYAAPRRDRNGDVVGTNALFVDVTELRRRHQQVTVLGRALRHNIRNELTVINGRLELAMEHADDELLEHLSAISDRADRLLSISEVAQRTPRRVSEIEMTRLELDAVARRLVDRARDQYPEATIDVDLRPIAARAPASINEALWELLENACEHAGESPRVDVEVRREGEEAIVVVADDGPGIPDHERQVLGEEEETPLEHGSGLGLWLVHWLLEPTGGSVTFDCDDGTEVVLGLPIAEPAE